MHNSLEFMDGGQVQRRSALLELIAKRAFSKQSDVVREMQRIGYSVTQPSISRDFRELGIVKVGGRYRQAVSSISREGSGIPPVRSYHRAGSNLVVLKTDAGSASMLALVIDRENLDGVMGTVAGDDTIFVATQNNRGQERLISFLGA